MNPRQRQGLLLVIIAAIGLIAVFVLIADYASSLSKQVGPKIQVVTLATPLSQYQQVTSNMLSEKSVPQKWAPPNAITDPGTLVGLVSHENLPAGTVLEQGMLTQAPALTPGHREIAITVDPETGIAGQVQPGDLVDIVATFQHTGSNSDYAEVVVPNVPVLSVGQPTGTGNGSVPVTFSLTPKDVLKVSYAESFAQKVRLSKVAPGPTTASTASDPAPYTQTP
jgi:pilus assembly protein CpaB